MKQHPYEELDALLDGELKGFCRRRVERHLRTCPLCATEFRRHRHIKEMLQENPPAATMSDSADFFWSKVSNEIERRGKQRVRAPLPRLQLFDWLGQQRWAMATVTAGIVAALGLLFVMRTGGPGTGGLVNAPQPPSMTTVAEATTSWPNSVATVLPAAEHPSVAVVWVNGLPWTQDMTQQQTVYAHPDDYLDI